MTGIASIPYLPSFCTLKIHSHPNIVCQISDRQTPLLQDYRLFPDRVPFHPWRWWFQCRVVYLPTSYLYANKCQTSLNPLLEDLRKEIYVDAFSSIRFSCHRNTVGSFDIKRPPSILLTLLNPLARFWETCLKPHWFHHKVNKTIRGLIRR
jgi:lanosterol synthase